MVGQDHAMLCAFCLFAVLVFILKFAPRASLFTPYGLKLTLCLWSMLRAFNG